MAKTWATRLVSANTRDGVDTRKKENSIVPCEVRRGDNLSVDVITGLGFPTVTNWGDAALELDGFVRPQMSYVQKQKHVDLERKFQIYCDMVEEPSKYDEDMVYWLELDAELRNSRKSWKVEEFWRAREEASEKEYHREQQKWKGIFTSIAKQTASVAMKRWIRKDIRRHVERLRR